MFLVSSTSFFFSIGETSIHVLTELVAKLRKVHGIVKSTQGLMMITSLMVIVMVVRIIMIIIIII